MLVTTTFTRGLLSSVKTSIEEPECSKPQESSGSENCTSARSDDWICNRILYATDFSEASLAAVPLLVEFQRLSSGSLRILHVSSHTNPQTVAEEQCFDAIRRFLREGLAQIHVGSEEYVISCGEPLSQGVVNEAGRFPADLLILGVRRASAYAARASPEIRFQIIAAAPCPVLSLSS
jgi:nucleotide-binding universal stress UspA family protein